MEHAQKLGQIRSLGVSNFGTSDLEELTKLAKLPVSVVQNWFDPLHQDRKVRKFCEEKGIKYMGYSTLGKTLYECSTEIFRTTRKILCSV